MLFDKPMWSIDPEHTEKQRVYCGVVDNKVDIIPEMAVETTALINVPSELFSLLHYLGVKKEDGTIVLFLEEEPGGKWIFGFDQGEGTPVYLLWEYPKGKLPRCFAHAVKEAYKRN